MRHRILTHMSNAGEGGRLIEDILLLKGKSMFMMVFSEENRQQETGQEAERVRE